MLVREPISDALSKIVAPKARRPRRELERISSRDAGELRNDHFAVGCLAIEEIKGGFVSLEEILLRNSFPAGRGSALKGEGSHLLITRWTLASAS